MLKQILLLILMAFLFATGALMWIIYCDDTIIANSDWSEYQGGPDRNQYSAIKQINTSNVNRLEIAWEYSTQDTGGAIETNPIIIGDTLYGMTANVQPFAINAVTGEEYWRKKDEIYHHYSRGLAYWQEGSDQRILYTGGEWLYALDATTGKAILSFGKNGRVSLKTGLPKTDANKTVNSTTPGTVYKDLIIMPLNVRERAGAAKGYIQAFNIKTGELVWVFHTIPKLGEYGYETWPKNAYKNPKIGGANSWAGMAIDRKRGIVYVPTGSTSSGSFGGDRKGRNLFANTLLALDAGTGERIWHFQIVHHDIMDRDLPAPPNLMTVTHNGKKIDAVAQVTKQGYVYLFNRETGKPLFPIKEKPVPQSYIPGEHSWPTQPFPTKPAPFARQTLSTKDISPYAKNRKELIEILSNSRLEGSFTPRSEQGTILFPGLDGGANWGGAAVDPDGILYVNSNNVPHYLRLDLMIPPEKMEKLSLGHQLYIKNCSSCHGFDRKGRPGGSFSLADIKKRQSREYVSNVISNGKGMMPSFESELSEKKKKAIIAFLFGEEVKGVDNIKEPEVKQADEENSKHSYQISGHVQRFLDESGYPAIRPPWGTLNAIDMNTGEYLWKRTLGDHKELRDEGDPETGTQTYGGPLVTAGDLLFIAAARDAMFRAYDKRNGKLLWEVKLPAIGFATPSTYQINGKQYVVIACGGTKLGEMRAQSYVAFTLSDEK